MQRLLFNRVCNLRHLNLPHPTPPSSAGSDGRLRFTPAQRQELLDPYNRSGLSAIAFVLQFQVNIIVLRFMRRPAVDLATSMAAPTQAPATVVCHRVPAPTARAVTVAEGGAIEKGSGPN